MTAIEKQEIVRVVLSSFLLVVVAPWTVLAIMIRRGNKGVRK
jgi:hypothetical protein